MPPINFPYASGGAELAVVAGARKEQGVGQRFLARKTIALLEALEPAPVIFVNGTGVHGILSRQFAAEHDGGAADGVPSDQVAAGDPRGNPRHFAQRPRRVGNHVVGAAQEGSAFLLRQGKLPFEFVGMENVVAVEKRDPGSCGGADAAVAGVGGAEILPVAQDFKTAVTRCVVVGDL